MSHEHVWVEGHGCFRCHAEDAFARGAAQEREACAKVAECTAVDDIYRVGNRPFLDTKEAVAQDAMRTSVAAAIRARGEASKPCAQFLSDGECDCSTKHGAPKCTECGGPHDVASGSFCPAPKCATCGGRRLTETLDGHTLVPCPDCAPKPDESYYDEGNRGSFPKAPKLKRGLAAVLGAFPDLIPPEPKPDALEMALSALRRLASAETFTVPITLAGLQGEELRARKKFAQATIAALKGTSAKQSVEG